MARESAEPASVPALAEEAKVVGREGAPLLEEAVVAPTGAQVESLQRPPTAGNTEEGPVTPPHAVILRPVVAPTVVSPWPPCRGLQKR
jgi:hypothetical protein